MKKRLTIAISGKPGAGKTTYAKHLANTFKLRYVSNGELFRRIAEERNIDLIELHKVAELDDSIDLEVDRRAAEEAKRGGVVIEGHLAAWVLKDLADLKILLTAPLSVRADRIAKREQKSLEDALREVKAREESNRMRALKYYNIDIEDLSGIDLIINTSILDIEGINKILEVFVTEYLKINPEKT
ncbi:MAG: AAA family ATPase [Thermofilaceae archaeon]|nr:AAA family ATPase [Thermofilaceae archaeon]MCX8181196.1 AAA family ATPase [Thermofilaceae archaeon]MDW8004483.1 AAA family ATPase [Thermofilaceae archaeon]